MPDEIPLPMPPGDADAVADLARAVGSAARCLASVDARIAGSAADVPGWLGDDAAAAAAQVSAVDTLVRSASDAVRSAGHRLASHTERLLETRSQVRALRQEQDEHFRRAWRRWGAVPDLQMQLMIEGPEVRAIVADLEAGEASRQRRHHALLEEIEDDAAATARVLVDSCAAVGGLGRSGDADRAVAYLAAELPGWGDHELGSRARALAERLGSMLDRETRERLARDALPFAGSPAFANALLAGLGIGGMRYALEVLGDGYLGPTSAFARLIAQALGAASPTVSPTVSAVLTAVYAPAGDRDARIDLAVLGMGAVLTASLALGSGGVDAQTASLWARQIAFRDHLLGGTAAQRAEADAGDAEPADPLAMAVAVLTNAQDETAAAAFLTSSSVWDVLLSMTWPDDGAALRQLTALAAGAPGVVGDTVIRGALEGLGNGLQRGDVHGWRVDRATADEVLPALADALALHVSVAGQALNVGVDGNPRSGDETMLRGLAYLTTDRDAAVVVEAALQQWVASQPIPFSVEGAVQEFPAIVVPNAYLAVQEYGQELAHALGELDLEKRAEDRAFLWNMSVGLAVGLAPGPWGLAAGVVAGYVAKGLHMDGTWEHGPDQEIFFAPDVADPSTVTGLSEDDWMHVYAMAHIAEDSFEGTRQALGPLTAPTSPTTHWWDPLTDTLTPGIGDAVDLANHGTGVPRLRVPR